MSTAGDFLLPDATLVVECVVFAIVLAVLSRAALPRLRAAADQREQQLAEAAETIADAAGLLAVAMDEAHLITTEARREAREILDRARARHDELVNEGRRKGREEYEWMAGRIQREGNRLHPERS